VFILASRIGADGRVIVAADATRERGNWPWPAGPRRWAEPTDGGGDPDGLTLLPTPTARDWKDGATDPDAVPVNGLLGRAVWHDFGPYTAAINRWEQVIGRPAPPPTEPGNNGRPRLSPKFVEWLMGLPDGWVTDVPGITRSAALKALGNGVVPHQAALALELLHTADEFGAWCCHCAKPWPCPTTAVATGLDCASHDPISGAVCQKPQGHLGSHGGMTKDGTWRNW
jgi:hypothetical protein